MLISSNKVKRALFPLSRCLSTCDLRSKITPCTSSTCSPTFSDVPINSSRKNLFQSDDKKKRVAVAVSGGVDSSVTALLVKQQGYDVVGVHMTNWDPRDETDGSACDASQDLEDARRVCNQLSIPFVHTTFIKEYWTSVFSPSLDVYRNGATPNPDVICNREIKFGELLSFAVRELGAEWMATGHYARTRPSPLDASKVELLKGIDQTKDQSYFLSFVGQEAMKRAMFPLGGLRKEQVREIAREHGLVTAAKRESMGLCFVGKRKFNRFIDNYVDDDEGEIRCIDSGKLIGEHKGIHHFTIGQGARIGGQISKWFVVALEADKKIVWVCNTPEHKLLFSNEMITSEMQWIAGEAPVALLNNATMKLDCRIRHSPHLLSCTVAKRTDSSKNGLHVHFELPARAVTPHQVAVFYDGDVCLGGGLIERGSPISFPVHSIPPQKKRKETKSSSSSSSPLSHPRTAENIAENPPHQ